MVIFHWEQNGKKYEDDISLFLNLILQEMCVQQEMVFHESCVCLLMYVVFLINKITETI